MVNMPSVNHPRTPSSVVTIMEEEKEAEEGGEEEELLAAEGRTHLNLHMITQPVLVIQ